MRWGYETVHQTVEDMQAELRSALDALRPFADLVAVAEHEPGSQANRSHAYVELRHCLRAARILQRTEPPQRCPPKPDANDRQGRRLT